MIESSNRKIFTPEIKGVEGDIPAMDISNSLKNDSTSNLKGFERNLNINLDRRYFTEYDEKIKGIKGNKNEEEIKYKEIDSYGSNNYIKPVDKDREIRNSEGANSNEINKISEEQIQIESNQNNNFENGR